MICNSCTSGLSVLYIAGRSPRAYDATECSFSERTVIAHVPLTHTPTRSSTHLPTPTTITSRDSGREVLERARSAGAGSFILTMSGEENPYVVDVCKAAT